MIAGNGGQLIRAAALSCASAEVSQAEANMAIALSRQKYLAAGPRTKRGPHAVLTVVIHPSWLDRGWDALGTPRRPSPVLSDVDRW
jgi:hypothetical protein